MKKKPALDKFELFARDSAAYGRARRICDAIFCCEDPPEVTDAALAMARDMALADDRPNDRKISKAIMAMIEERFPDWLHNQEDEFKAEEAKRRLEEAGQKAAGTAAYEAGRADGYAAGIETFLREQRRFRPVGSLLFELEFIAVRLMNVEKTIGIESPTASKFDMEDFERRIDRIEQVLGLESKLAEEAGLQDISDRLRKAECSNKLSRLSAERVTRQAKRFLGLSDEAMAEEAARDAPADLRAAAARAALDAIGYQRNQEMIGESLYHQRHRMVDAATEAVELLLVDESR